MGIVAIIDAERARYVSFYCLAKAQLGNEGTEVAGELLISINNDAIPYPYRYFRADLVAKDKSGSPQISEVRIDPDNAFQPLGFDFGAFEVEIYPLTWCSIQFVFDKLPEHSNLIESWIEKWLDLDDRNADGESGLAGAIHSATPIETNGTWWFMTADFGTAPVEAVIELIELLAEQGSTRVILKAG